MSDLLSLRKQLAQCKHRQLVILSGSELWQKQQLASLYQQGERVFWISSHSLHKPKQTQSEITEQESFTNFNCEAIEPKRLGHYLGQEIAGAIIDVKHGLSADTLGITAGMIQAGGLLILLTPDTSEWQTLSNPENSRFLNTPYTISDAKNAFTQHLMQTWKQSDIVWLEEHNPQVISALPQCINPANPLPTNDQKAAINAIHTVAFGHRKRPLVITADRGRGKSSILGIAAVENLINGKSHIAITASRLNQVGAAFQHAKKSLESLINDRLDTDPEPSEFTLLANKPGLLKFSYQGQTKILEFLAPDHLILNPTGADLLLVDEAAHLPTPVLTEILLRHHRLVFATTLHGYEGSGRGFELRFKKQLNQQTPDWKNLKLHQPIRWAENDPLESAINQALLLDANTTELNEIDLHNIAANELNFEQIDSKQLIANPALLKTLFGLLVQAHYQTSPNDLQQLLNAPNIKIIIARSQHQNSMPNTVLGAVLCVEEGKISPSAGRAHGHLVPQLLTKHYAQDDFLMLSTLRIMRIAVHPKCQRIGIGKQLITQVEQLGKQNRIDYVCSSFGSSEELLPFWFEQYFWPLHVGVKRDKASGSHNIVVAKPVSAMARQALSLIQTRFQEQFPHLLLESLPNLPALQVWPIIQTFRFKQRNFGYEKALQNYHNGSRPYESLSNQIWEWSLQSATKVKQGSITEQAIWCDKVLKKLSWQEVAHQHHLAGRKGVEEKLKTCIDTWLKDKQNTPYNNKARFSK